MSGPPGPRGRTTGRTPPALALLDAALTWTHGTLQLARVSDPGLPTPCEDWTLGALLLHMEDSLRAFEDAAATGHVEVGSCEPAAMAAPPVLVDRICGRACTTRAAWSHRITSAPVTVDGLRLGRDTTALVGALEIVVHGWDVARATGRRVPVPGDLAARLLPVARTVVTSAERGHRFAAPRPLPSAASDSERLLAHLGRDPAWRGGMRVRPA